MLLAVAQEWKRIADLESATRDLVLLENEHLRKRLEACLGCIEAAEAEGLHQLIVELRGSNETVDRLIDLIDRRLLWVREYAQPALNHGQATAADVATSK